MPSAPRSTAARLSARRPRLSAMILVLSVASCSPMLQAPEPDMACARWEAPRITEADVLAMSEQEQRWLGLYLDWGREHRCEGAEG